MNETAYAGLPPKKVSRRIALYASLWVLAVSTGVHTRGALLLDVVCGTLTLVSVARLIVTETRAARPGRLTYAAAAHFAAWFGWLLLIGLFPLWMEIIFFIRAHMR